jgi:DNA-binding winged helix-turn-helix (wHTH) protein/TolB-like protein/Flp pilus assembly protein TadD
VIQDAAPETYAFSGFRLDAYKRLLLAEDGKAVPLMPKAFDTLLLLVRNAGRTVSKDEILAEVWCGHVVEENNLTQNISALRKLFDERPGQHKFIATVPGRGYRFVAELQQVSSPRSTQAPAPAAVEEGPKSRPAMPARSRLAVPRVVNSLAVVVSVGAVALAVHLFGQSRDAAVESGIRTLAVLPFKPLVAANGNEAMNLGMADSLIMQLSKSEGLIVRPLNATRRFASLDQDPIDAGRTVDVDAIVDGTLHIANDRLRVSTRVLRVDDGRQLLSEQFDEPFEDIFLVQDSIVRSVANAIETSLATGTTVHQTRNVEAYELYMLGQLHASRLVMPEMQKGVEYFERAMLADPSYALPLVGIAQAQLALVLSNDVRASEIIPRAKIAAARAIELEPNLAEARSALGVIAFFYDWDWAEAQKQMALAVELSPNNANAHIFYAHLLSNLGRKEEALSHARRARQLDPTSLAINALEGQFLGHQGELTQAVERLRIAVSLEPGFWLSHHLLANALIDRGDYEEALVSAGDAKRLSPLQTYSDAFRGMALARTGRREEAEAVLNDLLRLEQERYVPPTHIAMAYAALGHKERAIEYLELAFSGKDARMAFLKIEPKWNDLRGEPGFVSLMSRMNF